MKSTAFFARLFVTVLALTVFIGFPVTVAVDRILPPLTPDLETSMQPRNTLVTVAPITEGEKKQGNIVLPHDTGQQYKKCEVIAVGPGMVESDDERSQCFDLKPGQLVLVKLQHKQRVSHTQATLEPVGIGYKTDDGRNLTLVEQSQVVAILAEEVDQPSPLQLTD